METATLPQIESLAAQLLRGPKRLRLRQLLSIEFLLSVVETDKQYPFDFVCHALTGFRPTGGDGVNTRLLDGDDLVADLVLLAERLSEDADIPWCAWSERMSSVEELARRFDVSTKTIFRWRRRGLSGWKVRFADRRQRLVFPDRCVRRFVARNTGLVARGSSFSQLTGQEREQIVTRAHQLVATGYRTVNSVARTISTEVGRAVETVRLILKHYDDAHPGNGIFNRSALQLERDDRRLALWEAYLDGASVESLADRFEKPVAWVYRTITEMRARELRTRKIEFVYSPEFDLPDADARILASPPASALRQPLPARDRRIPAELPPYLAQLFRIPLLTAEGERILFRKLNYLKFKADQVRSGIDPETAKGVELDRIEEWLSAAAEVKNEIVQANLRLVVGIAKRHVSQSHDLFELISDGNISLMRAVEKFDYSRGFKFSTYASWAIVKNFARSVPEQRLHRDRYQTGWDERLETAAAMYPEEADSDQEVVLRGTVERMLDSLDARERTILRERFGLDSRGGPQTLEQIGQRLGVSKERIRQLEARALSKLRVDFRVDGQRFLGA